MPEQGRNGKTKRAKRVAKNPERLKRKCMRYLQLRHDRLQGSDKLPINAYDLANVLKYWPDHKRETKRRRVRELVDEMRREGAPIASGASGYSVALTVDDFEKTEAFLRRHGIATLATNARLKRSAAHDRAVGQTRLPAYHALVTGRSALQLYLKPGSPPAPPQASPKQGADHSVAAPTTAETSGQSWPDDLFAFA